MAKSKTSNKILNGILVAESWNENGTPTKLKLCAKVETDYLISDKLIKPEHARLAGKSVIVKGEVKKVDGLNILTIHEIKENGED